VSQRSLKKRIQSLEHQIKIHEQKIREEKHNPIPDVGLIKHWQKEIETFKANIDRAKKRLRKSK
jgi:peptidoglycan hydrolase CwlO-like protein